MGSKPMSVIKHAPNQPYVETQGKFDWEDEETLVDRRSKLPYRIRRLVRQRLAVGAAAGDFRRRRCSTPT